MLVNTAQATEFTICIMKAGLTTMIGGDPGIGKSAIVYDIAERFNLKLIDIRLSQCDPTDLNGYPTFNKEINRAAYMPMDIFPLEDTPLPSRMIVDLNQVGHKPTKDEPVRLKSKKYTGFLIFLDEFNSATQAVQAASYKIVLDKKVGQYNLHPKAAMVCAGNLAGNNAIVNRLGTAMQSRLVHLELTTSIKEWIEWANRNDINHKIISYLNHCPDNLHHFDPKHNDKTFACPRTWEFASKLIKDITGPLSKSRALLSGTISESVAAEFIAYTEMYINLPTIEEILDSPETAKLDPEPAMMFAVSHMIAAHSNKSNINTLLKYVTRLPIEFETITLQGVLQRDESIKDEPCIRKWITTKGMELFS